MNGNAVRLLELIIETSWQVNGLLGAEFQDSRPVDSLAVGHLRILRGLTDGPLNMTRIARAAGVTRGTATAMVDRLVAMSLVERYGDQRNRRLVLVRLTPKGGRFFEDMHQRAIDCVRPLIADMDQNDRRQLSRLLDVLTSSLRDTAVARDSKKALALARANHS